MLPIANAAITNNPTIIGCNKFFFFSVIFLLLLIYQYYNITQHRLNFIAFLTTKKLIHKMYYMDTITINITLPKPMKQAVDAQIKTGLYTSFSEFVRNAVRYLLFSPTVVPYGPPFSPQAEKEILKSATEALTHKNKNIVLKTPQDIDNFFKNL